MIKLHRQLLKQVKQDFPDHKISIKRAGRSKHSKLLINGHKLTISSTPRNDHHAYLNALKQIAHLVNR